VFLGRTGPGRPSSLTQEQILRLRWPLIAVGPNPGQIHFGVPNGPSVRLTTNG
jgi:hypothetical protein